MRVETPFETPFVAELTVADNIGIDDTVDPPVAVISVNAPLQSTVKVTPPSAEAGSIIPRLTVTYTVADAVFTDNTVDIELPSGWEPAYSPEDESDTSPHFGSDAYDKAPRTSGPLTSYVVVTTESLESEQIVDSTPEIFVGSGNASLSVEVTGDTRSGR